MCAFRFTVLLVECIQMPLSTKLEHVVFNCKLRHCCLHVKSSNERVVVCTNLPCILGWQIMPLYFPFYTLFSVVSILSPCTKYFSQWNAGVWNTVGGNAVVHIGLSTLLGAFLEFEVRHFRGHDKLTANNSSAAFFTCYPLSSRFVFVFFLLLLLTLLATWDTLCTNSYSPS